MTSEREKKRHGRGKEGLEETERETERETGRKRKGEGSNHITSLASAYPYGLDGSSSRRRNGTGYVMRKSLEIPLDAQAPGVQGRSLAVHLFSSYLFLFISLLLSLTFFISSTPAYTTHTTQPARYLSNTTQHNTTQRRVRGIGSNSLASSTPARPQPEVLRRWSGYWPRARTTRGGSRGPRAWRR